MALDKKNGKTIWKTMRPNRTRSYCTPIIRTIEGRNQMILSGDKSVASYDPDTGKQHWVIDGPTDQFVASLVYNGDLLFMTCGFPQRHMLAIDPRGKGNVTKTHIKWRTKKDPSYVPSPASIRKVLSWSYPTAERRVAWRRSPAGWCGTRESGGSTAHPPSRFEATCASCRSPA